MACLGHRQSTAGSPLRCSCSNIHLSEWTWDVVAVTYIQEPYLLSYQPCMPKLHMHICTFGASHWTKVDAEYWVLRWNVNVCCHRHHLMNFACFLSCYFSNFSQLKLLTQEGCEQKGTLRFCWKTQCPAPTFGLQQMFFWTPILDFWVLQRLSENHFRNLQVV